MEVEYLHVRKLPASTLFNTIQNIITIHITSKFDFKVFFPYFYNNMSLIRCTSIFNTRLCKMWTLWRNVNNKMASLLTVKIVASATPALDGTHYIFILYESHSSIKLRLRDYIHICRARRASLDRIANNFMVIFSKHVVGCLKPIEIRYGLCYPYSMLIICNGLRYFSNFKQNKCLCDEVSSHK